MVEVVLTLAIAALAGSQVVETIHHGSIFGAFRDWTRDRALSRIWVVAKLGELFSCPFCFSHWTCAVMVIWLFSVPAGSLLVWPVYAFAATRVAQLINDLTSDFCRSPNRDEVSVTLDDDFEDEDSQSLSIVDNE